MENLKLSLSILCLLLFSLVTGVQNTFAQGEEYTKEDERFHVSFRFFPNMSTNEYMGDLEIPDSFMKRNWETSSTFGVNVEAKLLERLYLVAGLDYANFREVTVGGGFSTHPIDTAFFGSTLRSDFGYIAIPLGLKLVLADKEKMDFYMSGGVRVMYNIVRLGTLEVGDRVIKKSLRSSDSYIIADWVFGGWAGIGVEIPISPTTKLFIEPALEYYPRTNRINVNNRFGNVPVPVERNMYAVGVAVGVKL